MNLPSDGHDHTHDNPFDWSQFGINPPLGNLPDLSPEAPSWLPSTNPDDSHGHSHAPLEQLNAPRIPLIYHDDPKTMFSGCALSEASTISVGYESDDKSLGFTEDYQTAANEGINENSGSVINPECFIYGGYLSNEPSGYTYLDGTQNDLNTLNANANDVDISSQPGVMNSNSVTVYHKIIKPQPCALGDTSPRSGGRPPGDGSDSDDNNSDVDSEGCSSSEDSGCSDDGGSNDGDSN
jgi:hypothetical protein